ncbi:MAG: hypothetical protein ABJF11_09365 [Reichenbachiella sp.]|uniref:hypothetical protein n=1 Tax=Reichenbachiella sp. TaxID=2184521 RepID=UPI003267A3C6
MNIKLSTLIIGAIFLSCCSSKASTENKVSDTNKNNDCNSYKQYSKELNTDFFNVEMLRDINFDELASANTNSSIASICEDEELYFYSHFEGGCDLILISRNQKVGRSIKMHLVVVSDNGDVLQNIVLAEKTSYPGSVTEISSILNKKKLEVIRTESYVGDYVEDEDRYLSLKDSINTMFIKNEKIFNQISSDSLRSVK